MSWLGFGKKGKAENEILIPQDTLGLHLVFEPEDDSEIEVDIIAVHGLGGDSYSTWTSRSTNYLWLRDMLPKAKGYQNARIFTYGYDARVYLHPFKTSSKGRTFTFAERLLFELNLERSTAEEKKRPIIFVGHSLGGNVIKKALLEAHNDQANYGHIIESTRYLIFFGTPHQGADVATWAGMLDNLGSGLGLGSSDVTQELQRWSVPIVELNASFRAISSKFHIISYFETAKMRGVMVVPEGSARSNFGDEKAVGLQGDHLQICKFENAETSNARLTRKTFENILVQLKAAKVGESVGELEVPTGGLVQDLPDAPEDTDLRERLNSLRN